MPIVSYKIIPLRRRFELVEASQTVRSVSDCDTVSRIMELTSFHGVVVTIVIIASGHKSEQSSNCALSLTVQRNHTSVFLM